MGVAQMIVLRFTPKQIRSEPAEVIDEIRRTLEGARSRPPLNLRTVPATAGQEVTKVMEVTKVTKVTGSRELREWRNEWGRHLS
jgi:hypothetical protein